MQELILNNPFQLFSFIYSFLWAFSIVLGVPFVIITCSKIENIFSGLALIIFTSAAPTLTASYILNQAVKPFNESLEGTPYKFNSSLELLKSNQIFSQIQIEEKNGFKMYSFSKEDRSDREFSKIGKINCGNLTIKECVNEFKNNKDKIISSLNQDKPFEIVKNN